MQDFKNLTVWQMARQLTKSIYTVTVDSPGSEDLAFITEAMQEEILEKLIQIKRMLGSLANRLLSSIDKQRRLRRSSKAANITARPAVTPVIAES